MNRDRQFDAENAKQAEDRSLRELGAQSIHVREGRGGTEAASRAIMGGESEKGYTDSGSRPMGIRAHIERETHTCQQQIAVLQQRLHALHRAAQTMERFKGIEQGLDLITQLREAGIYF